MNSAASHSGEFVEFRGHAARFVARTALYLAALAVISSIVLMGERWLRFALLSFALVAPVLALLYAALRRLDRFSIDDRVGAVVSPGRGSTPFGDIRALRLHEAAGISSWSIRAGAGSRRLLVAGSPACNAQIREALEARAPAAAFTESTTAGVWLWLGLLLTPIVLQESFLYWLRSRQPQALNAPCDERPWSPSAGAGTTSIGRFGISPPAGYHPRPNAPGVYEGEDGVELRYEIPGFSLRMGGAQLWLLHVGIGVDSPADAIAWAGCAERGMLPLSAKTVMLGGQPARVVRFQQGAALVRNDSAVVAVDSGDASLTITIQAATPVADELLENIVKSVNVKRPGEP